MDFEKQMKVECPRCHRIITADAGEADAECNCHLICPDGDDIKDCTVTYTPWTGQVGYPAGIHNNPADEGEHLFQRTYYCSTHSKWYYKDKMTIPLDWEAWRVKRAPKKMRLSLGEY